MNLIEKCDKCRRYYRTGEDYKFNKVEINVHNIRDYSKDPHKKVDDYVVELAMQYTDGYSENIYSFANNINTHEGGTHLAGFKTALTKTINEYAKRNKLLKESEPNLLGEDIREGLTTVVSVKLPEPQFEGQTKTKLGNMEVRKIASQIFSDGLDTFLKENPAVGKQIIEKAKKAQQIYAKFTQEQVDKIFKAAAIAANEARIPLAKLAVEETGMGIVEDKVIKNHYAAEYIYNAYKNTQTCGIIERDEANGIIKIAEPIGVIGAVIPTTNPTSTAIFKTLLALKTRNGIIISPHPRAKESTIAAAKIVLEAAVKAGAPEGIIKSLNLKELPFADLSHYGHIGREDLNVSFEKTDKVEELLSNI